MLTADPYEENQYDQESQTMDKILAIAAGGAGGALLRYGISGVAYRLLGETFPWGTLAVNLMGCFLIGLLWGISERTPLSPNASIFLFTGILGGFTTFSTFGLETFSLFRDGEVMLGLVNVLASNVAGLVAVTLGFVLARLLPGLSGIGGAS